MKKLVLALALVVCALPTSARADVALGLFVGRPSGLDLKIDLQARSSVDMVLGWSTFQSNRSAYGHLTYLYTLVAGRGRSVIIPVRIGIGAALYGNADNVNVGGRAPLEIGFRFRNAPLEIYLEVALLLTFIQSSDVDGQGGLGLRFYF